MDPYRLLVAEAMHPWREAADACVTRESRERLGHRAEAAAQQMRPPANRAQSKVRKELPAHLDMSAALDRAAGTREGGDPCLLRIVHREGRIRRREAVQRFPLAVHRRVHTHRHAVTAQRAVKRRASAAEQRARDPGSLDDGAVRAEGWRARWRECALAAPQPPPRSRQPTLDQRPLVDRERLALRVETKLAKGSGARVALLRRPAVVDKHPAAVRHRTAQLGETRADDLDQCTPVDRASSRLDSRDGECARVIIIERAVPRGEDHIIEGHLDGARGAAELRELRRDTAQGRVAHERRVHFEGRVIVVVPRTTERLRATEAGAVDGDLGPTCDRTALRLEQRNKHSRSVVIREDAPAPCVINAVERDLEARVPCLGGVVGVGWRGALDELSGYDRRVHYERLKTTFGVGRHEKT